MDIERTLAIESEKATGGVAVAFIFLDLKTKHVVELLNREVGLIQLSPIIANKGEGGPGSHKDQHGTYRHGDVITMETI